MQEEWGHELPAEEGVYTGEVVTGEVVGEVVSGGPVEGEVYGKVVPVEVAGEQPAARIDLPPGRPSPAVQIDRARRLVRFDCFLMRNRGTPLDLLASPELADFHQQGWLHLGSGMSFAARIRKTWVSNKETPANLSRVFSFGNTKGGSPNSDFTDEIGVRSWPGPNVAIYAYGAEGADAKVTGWTQAAGAWIQNEEALYLFTVGADGTLRIFKNGHCIGTAKAAPMRSMARRYLYVGGHPFWKDHHFRGTIRDVHIWDRPVTWDELVATGPGWMATPPSGLWKGEFTSRNVPPRVATRRPPVRGRRHRHHDCEMPIRHLSGSRDLDARGSFRDELPGRCLHGDRRPTRGQVAHRRSLAIDRRERRRPAVVRVRAARGPWKSTGSAH